jgi:hypothetical protein
MPGAIAQEEEGSAEEAAPLVAAEVVVDAVKGRIRRG